MDRQIYRYTDRQIDMDRQIYRYTDRQIDKDRQIYRYTDRQIYRCNYSIKTPTDEKKERIIYVNW